MPWGCKCNANDLNLHEDYNSLGKTKQENEWLLGLTIMGQEWMKKKTG